MTRRIATFVLASLLAVPCFAALKPGTAAPLFKAQGATVIGVTSGNTERLAEFSSDTEKCAGKFAVAADAGAKIAKSYDATLAMKPDWSSRTSYVIGRDGKVVHVHDAMNPNLHVKETLDAVTALAGARPVKPAKTGGG